MFYRRCSLANVVGIAKVSEYLIVKIAEDVKTSCSTRFQHNVDEFVDVKAPVSMEFTNRYICSMTYSALKLQLQRIKSGQLVC